MLAHHFRTMLRVLFQNRTLLFWTYAFPIVLSIFFYVAFSDIEQTEKADVFDIAVVENDALSQDDALRAGVETLGEDGGDAQLFSVTYVQTQAEAETLLQDEKITGYVLARAGDDPVVVVRESGINETILQSAISRILQNETLAENLTASLIQSQAQTDAQSQSQSTALDAAKKVTAQITEAKANIRDVSPGSLSYTMIEYYTLIAMTCLYGAMLGMYAINNVLASMGAKGMRVSVSPAPKWKMVMGSALAAYAAQLVGLALLLAFTVLALGVDYGTHTAQIILLAVVGSFAGLSLGVAVGACLRTNETAKTSVVLSFTMAGCLFSGMMGITLKYVIDKNLPLLNLINPANMITDGLYALYYYGVSGRYWRNAAGLLIFSALLLAAACAALKRQGGASAAARSSGGKTA